MDNRSLKIGDILFNKYKIINILGEGNFSFVYLAYDICDKKKHFTIKEFFPHDFVIRYKNNNILPKETLTQKKINELNNLKCIFQKEANNLQLLSKTSHLGLMNFISYHEGINNSAYIVNDYIPTIPMQTYLKKLKTPSQLIKLLTQLLLTLEHIHYHNIYHQDLKIENILIKNNRTPLIIDFGSSIILQDKKSGHYFNTASADTAAIEQLSLNYPPEINESTDIYSIALIFYKIIMKKYPPSSKSREFAIERGEPDPYLPLTIKKFPCFHKHQLDAINKALKLYPEDRQQNVQEFLQELNKKSIWKKLFLLLEKII